MPEYQQVDYKLIIEIATRQANNRRPQGVGLVGKIMDLARAERISLEPLNPAPINDSDLLRIYAHYARPEQQDMIRTGQGNSTFSVLKDYLVTKQLISDPTLYE